MGANRGINDDHPWTVGTLRNGIFETSINLTENEGGNAYYLK